MAAYEVLLLNTAIPQIQAAQSGDTYVVPRDIAINATAIISANSATDALRITQTGAGNAILVEDSANPDSTPFVVTAAGDVGIGTSSPGTKLDVSGANAGTVLASRLLNTSTSASSDAQQFIYVNSGTAGDPYTTWTVGGVTAWSAGIRNSDSDSWYLSPGSNLGTSPAVVVTTSGNLGLGVTPSAWGSGYAALQIKQTALYTTATEVELGSNHFVNSSGQFAYIGNGFATRYEQYLGAHSWHTAPNNTSGAGFAPISFTQAMTLTATGNWQLGTTTAYNANGFGRHANIRGTSNAVLYIGNNSAEANCMQLGWTATESYVGNLTSLPLVFLINNLEKARITSGGYFKASNTGTYSNAGLFHEFYQTENYTALLVRATNGSFTESVLTLNGDRITTNSSYSLIDAYNGDLSGRFIVRDSGNAVNTNGSYGTISDQRLKQDIVDAGSQWDDLKAIRFRKYRMKADVAANPDAPALLGVVAQELEQTSPGLVETTADRDAEGNDLGTTTKSVKTSVLLMKAAVALQEAMARIETLEAEVAALKGA